MRQRWHDLLFAHWRVPAEEIQRILPAPLKVDTYDGDAWVSVIPFYMTGVRFRGLPPVPTAHAFAELNVRTYVTHDGYSAIWFFSLDAASTLAVIGARIGAALPYFRAAMSITRHGESFDYRSQRAGSGEPVVFEATYRPTGALAVQPGSLDYFLTERYSLFAQRASGIRRMDVVHPPWELQGAQAEIRRNTMLDAAGVSTRQTEPLLHFAEFQEVYFWPPVRVP